MKRGKSLKSVKSPIGAVNTVDSARAMARKGPKKGSMWRDYKGELYTVIICAVAQKTMEVMVVYKSEDEGTVWTIPLTEWQEYIDPGPSESGVVGERRARFELAPIFRIG
jgi:hypothetical protein